MRNLRRDEEGFTLVELIIYSALFVGVVIIVGSLLINTLRGDTLVRDSATATQTAQLITRSFKPSIANASDLQRTLTAGNGELVVAHTLGGQATPTWRCDAWFYDPSGDGSIYWKSGPAGVAIPVPTTYAGWTKLADGVRPRGSRVFTTTTGGVILDFTVDAGDRPPVLISTTFHQRIPESESLACF